MDSAVGGLGPILKKIFFFSNFFGKKLVQLWRIHKKIICLGMPFSYFKHSEKKKWYWANKGTQLWKNRPHLGQNVEKCWKTGCFVGQNGVKCDWCHLEWSLFQIFYYEKPDYIRKHGFRKRSFEKFEKNVKKKFPKFSHFWPENCIVQKKIAAENALGPKKNFRWLRNSH